jgi:DNA modification methylase
MPKIRCSYQKLVPLSELKPHPKNRNKHPKEQIARLAQIIDYQGIRHPIKVSLLSGFITSGHGRLEAAHKLELKEFPVDFQEYESEEQEYADLQSDNAIALWSELDLSGINQDLGDLGPDFDLDMLGIKDFVLEPADKVEMCDPDDVPEHVEPKTKRGDIYRLGDHRLMCGDSTLIDDVEKLMNGEKADLFLSDPPYGVSYTDKNEYLNSLGKPYGCPKAIENDHKTPEEMKEFWDLAFTNAHVALSDKASYYITAPQGGDLLLLLLLQAVRQSGFQLKHVLVWVKNNHVLGRCDYNYKHEPIVYGWKQDSTHNFYGNGEKKTSVWDFPKPLKNDLHPTMKPIALMEEAILNSTLSGNSVLDLFGGSGSTLIACEKSSRKCFMLELDQHYCDVIVARWEKYTGKKAELLNG